MFEGTITALVTPFRDGSLDLARLAAQVERQIAAGVDGVVPVGTTGESPTLTHDEHRRVVDEVIRLVDGRVKVLAGTGSNATREAVAMTRHAAEAGADGALVVTPYYNKPTQEGLRRHFEAVADVGLPVVLYNIPGRTSVALSIATIEALAAHPSIVAIKEATGVLDVASEIAVRTNLAILSGDDSLTLPILSVGGCGVVSVLSNLAPRLVVAMVRAARSGDAAAARALHLRLFPVCRALFIETNPIPIKTAMALRGLDSGELRLPLCAMDAKHRDMLVAAIDGLPDD